MEHQDDALRLPRFAVMYHGNQLMRLPHVFGYGVGYRVVARERTQELCVVVLVDRKVAPEALRPEERVPREIQAMGETVRTDVVERPRPGFLTADTKAYRPLVGGVQLGSASGWGTLGGIVFDTRNGDTVLLTNNHALTQPGARDVLPTNRRVFQPAGNAPSIGTSRRVVPMRRDGTGWTARVDAGICSHTMTTRVDVNVVDVGTHPWVITPPYPNQAVIKRGASTRLTAGYVVETDLTFPITDFDDAVITLGGPGSGFSIRPQAEADTFSIRGDSGALVVAADNSTAIGLLCSGLDTPGSYSYACQLSAVFEELEVGTACSGAVQKAIATAARRRLTTPPMPLRSPTSDADSLRADGDPWAPFHHNIAEFRARHLAAAPEGTAAHRIEQVIRRFAPQLATAILFDDDFALHLDRAFGAWLIQHTALDLIDYRLPSDFDTHMGLAIERLLARNPHDTHLIAALEEIAPCAGRRVLDLLRSHARPR